ncbi:MAG TPA: ABC transporter ATP-binding protein [Vicinamibacterales bacterium]|nr:ABC transporter ATP-binding protein [Vicinamibacterales bacterium]
MLSATRLSRRYGTRVAVDDISLEIARGEILALLGPNGAGKTTTLRLLSGLIGPSSGTIHFDGHPLDVRRAARMRSRVGFLPESPGLWERLTVRQNLVTYARLYGLPAPSSAVDASLTLFELRERAGEPCVQLSKGLKQRVALARTLLHDPQVVLLDEPTSGLDPESARDVRRLIVRLRDEHRAVLISTHNLDEAERVADRVAVLRTRLIATGTPEALRSRLFGRRVRIELRADLARHAAALQARGIDVRLLENGMSIAVDNAANVETPAIVKALVSLGADVEAVVPEEPSLEDVYLRLIRDQGSGVA